MPGTDPAPTTRRASDPAEIFLAIEARLRARVPDASEANCFLSLWDNPPGPNVGDWFIVICPGPGMFDAGVLDGAGVEAARMERSFSVRLYSTAALDQTGRHGQFLTEATLGIFHRWKAVLAALTQFDPVDDDLAGIICEPLNPTADAPLIAVNDPRAGWAQEFRFVFEWNLG